MPMPTAELKQWSTEPKEIPLGGLPRMIQGQIFCDRSGINLDGDFCRISQIVGYEDQGSHFLVSTEAGYTYRLNKSERAVLCEVHGTSNCPSCK